MKKLLLSIAIMASTILSAQNMTPVTRAEVNEINLKLEKVEKFGRQQSLGNKVVLAGLLTSVTGALLIQRDMGFSDYISTKTNKNFLNYWTGPGSTKLSAASSRGQFIMLSGLGITTIGITIKMNSYKHLPGRKRLSISLK
jgi:hypothetical protein